MIDLQLLVKLNTYRILKVSTRFNHVYLRTILIRNLLRLHLRPQILVQSFHQRYTYSLTYSQQIKIVHSLVQFQISSNFAPRIVSPSNLTILKLIFNYLITRKLLTSPHPSSFSLNQTSKSKFSNGEKFAGRAEHEVAASSSSRV